MISGAYDFTQIQGRQKHFIVLLQETIVLVSVWGDFKRRLFQIVLHRVRCVCQGWRPTCRHWSKGFGVIEQAYRHFKKKRTVFFTKYTHQRKKIRLQLVNITAQMGVPNMFASCQHVTSMILYMDVFSCRVMLLAGAVWQTENSSYLKLLRTRFVDFFSNKNLFSEMRHFSFFRCF